jgi:hypothetical protein
MQNLYSWGPCSICSICSIGTSPLTSFMGASEKLSQGEVDPTWSNMVQLPVHWLGRADWASVADDHGIASQVLKGNVWSLKVKDSGPDTNSSKSNMLFLKHETRTKCATYKSSRNICPWDVLILNHYHYRQEWPRCAVMFENGTKHGKCGHVLSKGILEI